MLQVLLGCSASAVKNKRNIDTFMDLRADLFPKLFDGPLFPPNTLLMVDRLVKEEFLVEVEAVVAGRPS